MSDCSTDAEERLGSARRLADLDASGLLEAATIGALDALTRVAHRALGTETTAAVTAVTAEQLVIVSISAEGEAAPPGSTVPLSHAMCQHVVTSGEPYIVDDASRDTRHALAVRHFGVGAYAGFPLHGTRGSVLGAVCAVAPGPRPWSTSDLHILGALATAAESVVAMHAVARRDRMAMMSGAVPADPLARVQHGLRTPLTSLLGFLELLLDGAVGDLSADQLDALSRCHLNAVRLRETVEALQH